MSLGAFQSLPTELINYFLDLIEDSSLLCSLARVNSLWNHYVEAKDRWLAFRDPTALQGKRFCCAPTQKLYESQHTSNKIKYLIETQALRISWMAYKRILKELLDLQRDPPSHCSAAPVSNDISNWIGSILGMSGTPYADGLFCLSIQLPSDYPMRPPRVEFATRVYHPNINSQGHLSLDILNDRWSPALTINKVLLCIVSLLEEPNPHDALEPVIAKQYLEDREAFNQTCKEHVRKYAM